MKEEGSMKKHINTVAAIFGAIVLAVLCLGSTNVSAAINDGMIIPYSSNSFLTEADVSGLTLQNIPQRRTHRVLQHEILV